MTGEKNVKNVCYTHFREGKQIGFRFKSDNENVHHISVFLPKENLGADFLSASYCDNIEGRVPGGAPSANSASSYAV